MRSTLRVLALLLALVVLLVPLTAFADGPCGGGPCFAHPVYTDGTCGGGGPCPDDPVLSQTCDTQAPPFYVVINRTFEDLNRPGTGCQPIILNNPDCTDCCGETDACIAADNQLVREVCPMLASKVTWTDPQTQTEVVYEMCCSTNSSSAGSWNYQVRLLHADGSCPVDPDNSGCLEGLPPGTGVDLPAPVIVGGLAVMGVGLLGVGMVLRRRTVRLA